MDFRYKWKNGTPPSRDAAAREKHLLDASQFNSEQDHKLAEEAARKHLGIPLITPDEETSTLPHAAPPEEKM
ncbi:hypothetical protein NOS3756_37610 [Nostoc sp. NIES-3756]|uniref:bromodomain-containing protein n=1 Tax=Nostoc sp. NIES-3756 TaxID=1751286 RepID=UPI0007216827|nr:bromodomain-containing protein [Nostoc sp. NIES-3756]BAT54788.1 hypothetical protein NOS3756_37610 [Nostoc sp. NIES-3756]